MEVAVNVLVWGWLALMIWTGVTTPTPKQESETLGG